MDKEYDVVILGSGASGMMSAITAYENGSSVGLFEKQSIVGGTAGVSGGIIWAPMNSHMKAKGIEDDRNKAIEEVKRLRKLLHQQYSQMPVSYTHLTLPTIYSV